MFRLVSIFLGLVYVEFTGVGIIFCSGQSNVHSELCA